MQMQDTEHHRQPSGSPGRPRFDSGFEVTSRLPSGALPGRVVVSAPVWLCCVYPTGRHLDRIDPQHEAARLDKLLQAASDAWRKHTSVTGSFSRQCVFSFQTHDGDREPTLLPVRVELAEERPDCWITRLDLAA